MAENVLETRIQLRYGTYSQWMNSNVILKLGEAAVCAFPSQRTIESSSNSKPENTPPAIGVKIGDGTHYFSELPWVQAIAADVYSWAKQSAKPSYNAQEISGLQSYVENLLSGDTEVTIAPRVYQLYQGTGNNVNKYYLRYKENNEDSNWILDTSTYIDLNDLVAIREWIGAFMEEYPTMGTATGMQTLNFINNLNKVDTVADNYFVTAVSESKGIISVERAQPSFNNLSGYAEVSQGGTGRNTLPEDEVLVGNGTNQIKTIPIADSIANNTALVPNYIIKAYIDTAVAGLTGAMHFIGDAGVVIQPNSSVDPRIPGYNFSSAQPGDVILYDAKEFVWNGSQWRLLGDEGSYAVKGSIVDTDINAEANIQQSKIAGLAETFNTKVDKVDGKTLTSNDFTNEEKDKLDLIEDGAQRNVIEHIYLNDTEIIPATKQGNAHSVSLKIEEFDELSRQKLTNIEESAQENKIEKIIYDGEEVKPDENKVITINSDPHTEHINVIESISVNGVDYPPDANKKISITIDQAALNLNVLEGAIVPDGFGGTTDVRQINKKLDLERIAVTGNVQNLLQTNNTYITLDCGSSTEVV